MRLHHRLEKSLKILLPKIDFKFNYSLTVFRDKKKNISFWLTYYPEPHYSFKLSRIDNSIHTSFWFLFFCLFITLPVKRKIKKDRTISIYWHMWTTNWNLWVDKNSMIEYPKWRDGYFDIAAFVKGKHECVAIVTDEKFYNLSVGNDKYRVMVQAVTRKHIYNNFNGWFNKDYHNYTATCIDKITNSNKDLNIWSDAYRPKGTFEWLYEPVGLAGGVMEYLYKKSIDNTAKEKYGDNGMIAMSGYYECKSLDEAFCQFAKDIYEARLKHSNDIITNGYI